jgi:aspartate kinase
MAINDLGHRAISLTGSQAGIVTDTSHTKARILDVRADRIRDALNDDLIVLVAGFQGVSTSRDVTTLGRGGSDTTAVAVAAALGAEVCEIYTDVSGVFTADPRLVPDARKLPYLSFEEMLEMAASGAKVLQLRSVEYARTHGVRIHCRSSFEDGPGTVVLGEDETMEHPLITAVTHSTEEARITLLGVPDRPGAAAAIFRALADENCNVDTIIQRGPACRRAGARAGPGRAGAPDRNRPRDRQGLDRRRRHALPPRCGGTGVRDARRARHQHRDDLHLADQDLLCDSLCGRAAGRPLAPRGV